MGCGMGWDCSVGVLCDFGGNNHFEATGGLTQGSGAQASLGILFNYGGNDVYEGYGQGYASPGISYHDLPECGGNFSFLIDYGGNNKLRLRGRAALLHPARRRRRLPHRSPQTRRGHHNRRQAGNRRRGTMTLLALLRLNNKRLEESGDSCNFRCD